MPKNSTGALVMYEPGALPPADPAELARVASLTTEPDTSEVLEQDLRGAMSRRMDMIAMRIDRETLAWFKSAGAGYQGRIREVLREHIRRQQQVKQRPTRQSLQDILKEALVAALSELAQRGAVPAEKLLAHTAAPRPRSTKQRAKRPVRTGGGSRTSVTREARSRTTARAAI